MLAVDIIGLIFTICLTGPRYPHYVLCAAVIHDLGRVLMALFLHGQIESVVAAGAFGTTVAGNIKAGMPALLLVFSGSLANYIVSATTGGVEEERSAKLLNPAASVRHPFAVVNLRLALLSFLVNSWLLLW